MLWPRKKLYDLSDPVLPQARTEERQIMLDLLQIEQHHLVCDVPAWGGYLAEGIANVVDRKQIICIDPSPRFVNGINAAFTRHRAQQDQLPLPDASVDRVGSMVGMHHLEDKLAFIRETHRILKPGGRLAVSEVVSDTAVAKFLNGPVHQYAAYGHCGAFVVQGGCSTLLRAAGFQQVVEMYRQLYWRFSSTTEMARFCWALLGLTKASEKQVLDALLVHFDVQIEDDLVKLPWSLVYCTGTK